MTPPEAFSEARADSDCRMHSWKSDEHRAYAVALVRAALANYEGGSNITASDDVPDSAVPAGSPGIPGSVHHMLVKAHVLEHIRDTIPERCIYGGRRMSKRKGRNGAWVDTYRLKSGNAATAFLRANNAAVQARQGELVLV